MKNMLDLVNLHSRYYNIEWDNNWLYHKDNKSHPPRTKIAKPSTLLDIKANTFQNRVCSRLASILFRTQPKSVPQLMAYQYTHRNLDPFTRRS